MQVFKVFLKVLKSKWISALIYIIVFLLISIAIVKQRSVEFSMEITSLKIAVFDKDDTPESRALIDFIDEDNEIVEIAEDREKILDALYSESIGYALIINEGYSEKLASGETDELFGSYHVHDSYSVVYTEQVLNEYVSSVRAGMAGGKSFSEAVSYAGEVLSTETEINSLSESSDNELPTFFGGYFRYMPYILISSILGALCPVLLSMTKKDIRYRTDCSCLNPTSYTLQLYAGSGVFVAGVWLVLMAAGLFLFGGMYSGRQWLAVLNSLVFTTVVASIAIFIVGFSPSDRVLSIVTQILGLGMSFLCGIFVPLQYLSSNVVAFSRFLPVYWYARANEIICGDTDFTRGSGLTEKGGDLILYMGVELAFTVTFAVLSVLVRRLRYGKASAVSIA